MTPQAWIERLEKLVAEGRDEDALVLASSHIGAMRSVLSQDQFFYVMALVEAAQLVADIGAEAERQGTAPQEAARPSS